MVEYNTIMDTELQWLIKVEHTYINSYFELTKHISQAREPAMGVYCEY